MPTFRVVLVKNQIYDIGAIVCPSCKCLYRNPVQVISCGHRICHACIEKMESLRCGQCPVDKQQFEPEQTYADKGFQKDLQNLKFTDEHISLSYEEVCQYKVLGVQGTCLELYLEEENVRCATTPEPESSFKGDKMELTVLSKCEQQRKEIALSELQSVTWKNQLQRQLESTIQQLQRELDSEKSKNDQLQSQLDSATDKIDKLQHKLDSVTDKIDELQCQFDSSTQGFARKRQLKHSHNAINEDASIQSSLSQYIHELSNPPQGTNYLEPNANGEFFWTIPNVQQLCEDNEIQSICSPVFRTSNGHNTFLRVYLNGEGLGKGTHISLFFTIFQSENDDQLQWPFNNTVQLTLINYQNMGDSITRRLTPNTSYPTFQQPDYKFNIGSGFPRFAPIILLLDNQFIQNGAITFRCTV